MCVQLCWPVGHFTFFYLINIKKNEAIKSVLRHLEIKIKTDSCRKTVVRICYTQKTWRWYWPVWRRNHPSSCAVKQSTRRSAPLHWSLGWARTSTDRTPSSQRLRTEHAGMVAAICRSRLALLCRHCQPCSSTSNHLHEQLRSVIAHIQYCTIVWRFWRNLAWSCKLVLQIYRKLIDWVKV